eukprot:CAMPEP_0206052716 /NCGR_PEP_ID=MMETSP1466-20131121/34357_1 /ASSEMBLY_ACC=CAM_ASM_001126 /TAXON_ID=44452 /ORGANISM="Pavlova gyrans, Strain CCMP608" /LENGTH=245 /DNA_ID=CAMNT_0053427879 /DNA_START=76 /DNA_END=811 /DNA_ORIENTATION=-
MSMTSVMSKSRPAGPGAWAAAAGSMGQKPGRNATASNHSAHVSPDPVHAHVEEHGPVPVRVLEDGVERLLVEEVARLRAEADIGPALGEVAPRGRNDDAPDVALRMPIMPSSSPGTIRPSPTRKVRGSGVPSLSLVVKKRLPLRLSAAAVISTVTDRPASTASPTPGPAFMFLTLTPDGSSTKGASPSRGGGASVAMRSNEGSRPASAQGGAASAPADAKVDATRDRRVTGGLKRRPRAGEKSVV